MFGRGSKVPPVFGGTLDEPRCQQFLIDCLDLLEAQVTEEGLYRMAGRTDDVANAKKEINKGKPFDLSAVKSAHTLAALLKSFFRELKPEPLLTFNLYQSLIAASQENDIEERRRLMWGLLSLLPSINFKVLTVLMSHLQFVVQNKASNKMDATNLAIVFGPILCGSRNENVGIIVTDVAHVIRLITFLITECDFFFPDKQVEIKPEKPAASASPKGSQIKPANAEGTIDSRMPVSPLAETKKDKEEKKEKKKEKEKKLEVAKEALQDEKAKEKTAKEERKKRASNIKKFNEEWNRLASASSSASSSPSSSPGSGRKRKQEKKQEQIERKERKARQKRINERWERLNSLQLARSPQQQQQRKEQMKHDKERMEGLYSQRSTRLIQRMTVNEFLQERASRIKSGSYTYEELQEWNRALEQYDG